MDNVWPQEYYERSRVGMVDNGDLKSPGCNARAGSTPAETTVRVL